MENNKTATGEKLFSFAVISDTHVNPDEDTCNSPFPVNARSNPRLRHVISDLNQRDIAFVVHLGDLVHPVPETGNLYARASNAYHDITAKLNVPIHELPGNHDIGDTPVKGAPASPTTQPMIDAWTKEFGAQYRAFSHGDIRYLLINAQLINSGLPDEEVQKVWLEAELEAAAGGRIMLMLHHPAYLCFPDEPIHYDNTNPPGRQWLLDLLERYKVEALFAGHAHNFWYDRYHETDYYLAPSTSFVRQDYSDMLRVIPPENTEDGRDDKAKLGYFIVNVYADGHSLQFVRTFGAEQTVDGAPATASALAPTPKENATPKIGFDLRQNWAEISEVAPSGGLDEFDRKQVRNDYPLLALIEMGVRDVRIPLTDLRDPMRLKRLATLNHLGMRPTIFCFGIPEESDLALIEQASAFILDWEMTVDWDELDALRPAIVKAHQRTGLPIYLSRMRSKADLASGSVYFHVINHGFSISDSAQLEKLATMADAGIKGAVFRLANTEPVAEALAQIEATASTHGISASVHLRVAGDNPAIAHDDHDATCARVSEAISQAGSLSVTRVFCDTLADNDRGYFVRQGAISRTGNPNPLFDIVKSAHVVGKV